MAAEPRFHTGWNQIFHAATEEPACHPTWPEAAESLKELMRSYADEDDTQALEEVDWANIGPEDEAEWLASDEAPAMLACVQSILHDDGPREPENYYATVEDHNYRRIGFFLFKVMCDDPVHLSDSAEGEV